MIKTYRIFRQFSKYAKLKKFMIYFEFVVNIKYCTNKISLIEGINPNNKIMINL